MQLKDFATELHPIRCSSLPSIVQCPWKVAAMFLSLATDESGEAADTGSLVHKGVEYFHRHDHAAGLEELRRSRDLFPRGDVTEAERHYAAYCADPRNRNAEILAVEEKVTFQIPAAPEDPTGKPIYVSGTLDQRRLTHGAPKIWDLKTGKRSPIQMLRGYALQLSGYSVGANCEPGGFIRSAGYLVKGAGVEPTGVFLEFALSLEQCRRLLDAVRLQVARIRAGNVAPIPGDHCLWCPMQSPEQCLRKLPHFEETPRRARRPNKRDAKTTIEE